MPRIASIPRRSPPRCGKYFGLIDYSQPASRSPPLAGNTTCLGGTCPLGPDHPRTRGEDVVGGAHTHLPITPASAGNTRSPCRSNRTEHSRSRGENEVDELWIVEGMRSPPLGGEHSRTAILPWLVCRSPSQQRGKLAFTSRSTATATPARAGNTSSESLSSLVLADHPRTGGEHKSSSASIRGGCRLPPLGGEHLCPWQPAWPNPRLPPLTRGTPFRPIRSTARGTDHPRSRGEHACVKPLFQKGFSSQIKLTG